jgi:hypothetical protein
MTDEETRARDRRLAQACGLGSWFRPSSEPAAFLELLTWAVANEFEVTFNKECCHIGDWLRDEDLPGVVHSNPQIAFVCALDAALTARKERT